jgi:hypothetical protein
MSASQIQDASVRDSVVSGSVAGEVKVLETAEDIQARREQVLQRYEHFKEAAKLRRNKLENSREYQFFKRDADELEAWLIEKLQSIDHNQDILVFVNGSGKSTHFLKSENCAVGTW